MRLIQLLGDGVEELWNVPDELTDENIQTFYKNYKESEYDMFDEYVMDFEEIEIERVYVDEVYV